MFRALFEDVWMAGKNLIMASQKELQIVRKGIDGALTECAVATN